MHRSSETIGAIAGGIFRQTRQQRGLRETEFATRSAEISPTGRACADEISAEGRAIEIFSQNLLLALVFRPPCHIEDVFFLSHKPLRCAVAIETPFHLQR